jgi:hypothetical protein
VKKRGDGLPRLDIPDMNSSLGAADYDFLVIVNPSETPRRSLTVGSECLEQSPSGDVPNLGRCVLAAC